MIPWPSSSPDLFEGTRYRVVGSLAQGTLSYLLAVEHAVMKKPLVGKVCLTDFPSVRARFVLGAQLLSQIDHPNVVRVLDAAELIDDPKVFARSRPFYVMEPLVGHTLQHEIRHRAPLPIGKAIRWARRLTSAVSAVHRAGLVHRDFSPTNVFVVDSPDTPLGELKFLGFGVDKMIDPAESVPPAMVEHLLERWGAGFVAPETLLRQPTDERSDVFGLGLILEAMLRGLFRFSNLWEFEEVCRAQIEAEPPGLDGAILTTELVGILRKATSKDPSLRYQTADELDQALLRFETWAPSQGDVLERRLSRFGEKQASDVDPAGASVSPARVPAAEGPSAVVPAVHAAVVHAAHAPSVDATPAAVGAAAPAAIAWHAPDGSDGSDRAASHDPRTVSSSVGRALFDPLIFVYALLVGTALAIVLLFAARMLSRSS